MNRYLPVILEAKNNHFMPRAKAETDPSFKQIIPYVVITDGKNILHYVRGKKAGEQRLVAKGSVGIGGHINRADAPGFSLYVQVRDVNASLARAVELGGAKVNDPFQIPGGAMIAGINDDGPAEKAKLRPGDIVIRFNNHDVKEMRNLPRIVAETPIGQEVPVTVWRDGKEVTLNVTVWPTVLRSVIVQLPSSGISGPASPPFFARQTLSFRSGMLIPIADT